MGIGEDVQLIKPNPWGWEHSSHRLPHILILKMTWLEAMPPLIIITGAVGLMGILPAAVHRAFNNGEVCFSSHHPVQPLNPSLSTRPPFLS